MSKHPAFELAREVREGKIPSNVTLEKTLDSTKEALETEAAQRGQGAPEVKLAKDAAQFLDTTKQFLQEKNKGEVIQKFFLDAKEAAHELSEQFQRLAKEGKITYEGYGITDLKQQAKYKAEDWAKTAQFSIDSMKGFVITLVDSPEFRGLLLDFISLVQETIRFESMKAPPLGISEQPTQPLTEEVRQKGIEGVEFGKAVLSDIREGTVPIPEDRKRALFTRFQFLLRKMSASPEFRRAVNGLFQIVDQIHVNAQLLKREAKQEVPTLQKRAPHLYNMWQDGITFLAGFVGQDNINRTIKDFQDLYQMIMDDPRVPRYFSKTRSYIYLMMNNPEMLEKEDSYKQLSQLLDEARQWTYDPKYNDKYNALWRDFQNMAQAIKTDPMQSRLAKDATTLAHDLFLDESGQPSINIMTTGLNQFRSLVAPILIRNLEQLPVPSFSGSDETYDWTIQNMILNGRDIIPDKFDLRVWGNANVSLSSTEAKAITFVTLWVRDITIDIKDLKFHFVRKSFPKLDETGVADVMMAGKGSAIKLVWKIEGTQDQPWTFSLYDAQCNLSNFDVTVKESTHTWLMKLITSLWSGTMKRQVEYRVEKTLRENLEPLNTKLAEALRR